MKHRHENEQQVHAGGTMKFGIVGAGAMGCLFGSFLAKQGEEVWLVDVWKEHVELINEKGLSVMIEGKSERIPIQATTNTHDVGRCDAVIIATKFRHTRDAVRNALNIIDEETVVITLQNGIGNVETISEFVNKDQIVFGVTTLGSVVKGPGHIEATVTKVGQTYLWSVTGEPGKRVKSVIDACNRAGLDFSLTPDVKERIWRKLCLNAGLSVPCAIPRLECGDYIEQPHSLELTRGLVQEIVAVAEHEGVNLDPEEMYENVVNLARQSPNHRTSILMDVVNHRKTEIDCLNGAVVSRARKYGIKVPFNSVISNIIRITEDTYDKSIRRDPNG